MYSCFKLCLWMWMWMQVAGSLQSLPVAERLQLPGCVLPLGMKVQNDCTGIIILPCRKDSEHQCTSTSTLCNSSTWVKRAFGFRVLLPAPKYIGPPMAMRWAVNVFVQFRRTHEPRALHGRQDSSSHLQDIIGWPGSHLRPFSPGAGK